jgi:hypothetical protein
MAESCMLFSVMSAHLGEDLEVLVELGDELGVKVVGQVLRVHLPVISVVIIIYAPAVGRSPQANVRAVMPGPGQIPCP